MPYDAFAVILLTFVVEMSYVCYVRYNGKNDTITALASTAMAAATVMTWKIVIFDDTLFALYIVVCGISTWIILKLLAKRGV